MSWIQTYSGVKFDLVDPQPSMVHIGDIAHALSNVCRFAGHVRDFYSVAQHSVLVSEMLPSELQFQGLMHDAAEAYVADLAWPLKQLLPEYKVIEDRVYAAIAAKFGLPATIDPAIKHVDNVLLMVERRELMRAPPEPWASQFEALVPTLPRKRIQPLAPGAASSRFFDRYFELRGFK